MEIDVHNTYKIFVHISYITKCTCNEITIIMNKENVYIKFRGARRLSGRVSDSGARGRGFVTYRRRVMSLSKTLYSPKTEL